MKLIKLEAGSGRKLEVKYEKTWLCQSGFVYHYSNHFTAPRHANLIDTLAFPAIPDLINLKKKQKNTTNLTTFPIFPCLCGLAPPQGTSHH